MTAVLESPSVEPGSKTIIRRSPRFAAKTRTSSTPTASPSGPAWHRLASCAGLETWVFYGAAEAQPMTRPEIERARSVCAFCPVRPRCLADALDIDEGWGVWGGYTKPERARALDLLGDTQAVLIALEGGTLRVPSSRPTVMVEFEPFDLDALVRV